MLESIKSPSDLKALSFEELDLLSEEIRQFLITKVSKTGGHLGPNLGVVELTIAIHRTFDSPKDVVLFDTGHQSYVHKILTGRSEGFDLLRQKGGLSGYPSRGESEHDVIENSHASTALSWGDGISRGFSLTGQSDRHVVVVVGDGSDIGGGASIMGTLSGGGKQVISIGEKTLLGANSGCGISLGDNCVIEAGTYITAASKLRLPDGEIVKAATLSGAHNLLFRRNSLDGALEVVSRTGTWGGLNSILHAN